MMNGCEPHLGFIEGLGYLGNGLLDCTGLKGSLVGEKSCNWDRCTHADIEEIFATKIVDAYRGLELPCAVPSINKVSDQESNKNSTDSHTHDGAKR